ncbi:M23 family metallopeptidase [Nocardia sp. IFM 10818]
MIDTGTATSHRADTGASWRVRSVSGAAVAAGALLATTVQMTPAAATPAPPPVEPDPIASVLKSIEEAIAAATGAAPVAAPPVEAPAEAPEPEIPAPAVEVAPTVEPAAAPFGLAGLPAEIRGPLAQAEQAIKSLQEQVAPLVPAPQIAAPPAVLPVGGAISSGFGTRWGSFHYGVDIADALGTPIHSAMGGTVVEAGPASGFGLWVRVLQDDGTTAVYGHVNDIYAHVGQRVNAGDVIASVGNRGQSTGPHLHLEIWDQNGSKIDPVSWLAANGVLMEQHWGAD